MSCIVVDHPAEQLAFEVIQSGVFNIACIDKLVSLLPSETPARMSGPSDDVCTRGPRVPMCGARSLEPAKT